MRGKVQEYVACQGYYFIPVEGGGYLHFDGRVLQSSTNEEGVFTGLYLTEAVAKKVMDKYCDESIPIVHVKPGQSFHIKDSPIKYKMLSDLTGRIPGNLRVLRDDNILVNLLITHNVILMEEKKENIFTPLKNIPNGKRFVYKGNKYTKVSESIQNQNILCANNYSDSFYIDGKELVFPCS